MKGPVQQACGWLFDLYAQGNQMVLWFVLEDETRLRLVQPFTPSFYIDAAELRAPRAQAEFRQLLARLTGFEFCGETARRDFWSAQPRPVLQIRVTNLDRYHYNLQTLFRRWPGLTYFNCDIPPEIHYCYETGLFPTAHCRLTYGGEQLLSCTTGEDPLATGYALPPVRAVELRAEGVRLKPRPVIGSLSLQYEGRTCVWQDGPPDELLESLNRALHEIDPDLIWSAGGDALLFPALLTLAQRCHIPLALDREPHVERQLVLDGRSYQSYGRVLYNAPDYPLFGRWHIDRQNSFWGSETGLAGVVEVARLSQTPVQRTARRSSGTGISSMQLALAYRDYLIPWKKSQPEAWKSALTLLQADRGGLVYQPRVGLYEDVYELDFVSMFPSIMAHHNVSSETVNCTCCPPSPELPRVPGIGYTLCRQRRGLVSRTVGPLIAKRCEYKQMMAAAQPAEADLRGEWDQRQGAIKWLLVTCFGYLGYRNARFGRIEAHEATCAFSREILLTAKAICEERGFELLHAIVDCVWVRKPGTTAAEIAELIAAINQATELRIALEGHYHWLAFLPSRQEADTPVPNRFFGCMTGGKLKYRGIECRRSDQAPYVKQFQLELLNRLAAAGPLAACRAQRDAVLALFREADERLRRREVPLELLLLRRRLSMDPQEYHGPGMAAIAARQALRGGLKLHAGEATCYLVTAAHDRDPDSRLRLAVFLRPEDTYDVEYYCEQLRRAAATVLECMLDEPLAALPGAALARVQPARRRPKKVIHETGLLQLDWLNPLAEAAR